VATICTASIASASLRGCSAATAASAPLAFLASTPGDIPGCSCVTRSHAKHVPANSSDVLPRAARNRSGPGKLNSPFAHVMARRANQGKASLRRQQCDMAKTNAAMAIWLGKQLLGQTDRRELSGPGGGAIPLDIDVTKLTEQQLAQLEDILEAVTEPIALEAVTEG
jgi:hypothetical protein